jgi:hypothetical protein
MKLTEEEKDARRKARKEERRIEAEAKRIEAEKNQKPVKELTISIEWKKSRTWGSNPHAMAEVLFHDGTFERRGGFTASGCGYDKESTVIAEIFNDFLLYKLYRDDLPTEPKYWDNGEKVSKPCGVTIRGDWKSYEDGIGTSCYPRIAEYIGGRFETIASGKTFDVFKYTDGIKEEPKS